MVSLEFMIDDWGSLLLTLMVSSEELIQMIVAITIIVFTSLLYVGMKLFQTNYELNRFSFKKSVKKTEQYNKQSKKYPNDLT